MREADLDAVAEVAAAAFAFDLSDPQRASSWRTRLLHPLLTDPDGAFVATADGQIIGAASAIRSDERLWVLSLLTVDPRRQSRGAGRALLDAAFAYAHTADAKLIVSSNDGRAIRSYTRTGLAAHPTFQATGLLRRARLAPGGPVTEIGELTESDDLSLLDTVTRQVRGGAYGPALRFMVKRNGARLLHAGDRGFVLIDDRHGIGGLLAADGPTATTLFWHALGELKEGQELSVRWLSAQQPWAIDAAVQAGLQLSAYGAIFASGPGTLAPFIPTGPFS
jgi:ribosomal protein S18 acetylase RimI-like enzyme